ncbi:MAG: hypothetical protein GY846_21430 [Deltaproteobacteria bacterium]|nr:hypothetical protein [Deltaproteobacteria bacterium]
MDTIAVVLVVCLAVGYLVRRYMRRNENTAGCECENKACPLRGSGSGELENCRDKMICEGEKCKDD